jgi:pSer/pThr/pTyr-binding forkhead associated (FHA) protein
MVVCPRCGKSSYSTTHCVSCGARLDETAQRGTEPPANPSPTHSAFVSAIHSEWPALQLDEDNRIEYALVPPEPEQSEFNDIGHVLVRLKPGDTADRGNPGNLENIDEYIVELNGQDVIIGRLPTCEICIEDDPLVSRYHANLSFRDGVYVLADMGSSNGTYLNDEAITEDIILQAGDEITVGIHEIMVRSGHSFPEHLRRNPHQAGKGAAPAVSSTDPTVSSTDPSLRATRAEGANQAEEILAIPISGEQVGATLPSADPSLVESVELGMSPMQPIQATAAPETMPQGNRRDFGALQSQLEDIARVLGQQVSEDTRVARELRSSLEAARATLAHLLATELEPMMALFSVDLGELIQVAGMAAENPRHVDYVTALAARAGTIATTLAALQRLQSQSGILANLHALYAQLDGALG